MARFLLLLGSDQPFGEEEAAVWVNWSDELEAAGRLESADVALSGITLSAGRADGDAEAAESGPPLCLAVIYADDLEDAAEIAASCPELGAGVQLELRPLFATERDRDDESEPTRRPGPQFPLGPDDEDDDELVR
jgi:hypothetical protein